MGNLLLELTSESRPRRRGARGRGSRAVRLVAAGQAPDLSSHDGLYVQYGTDLTSDADQFD